MDRRGAGQGQLAHRQIGNLVGEGKVSPSYLPRNATTSRDFHLRAEVKPTGHIGGRHLFPLRPRAAE